jgi:hypothetical protein
MKPYGTWVGKILGRDTAFLWIRNPFYRMRQWRRQPKPLFRRALGSRRKHRNHGDSDRRSEPRAYPPRFTIRFTLTLTFGITDGVALAFAHPWTGQY